MPVSVTITAPTTVTVTDIQVKMNSGDYQSINGSSNAKTFSGISASDNFLVKVTFSSGDLEYYYIDGAPGSTGEKTLTKGTESSSFHFAEGVYSVTFYGFSDNGTYKLNVRALSKSGLNPFTSGNCQLVANGNEYYLTNKYNNAGTLENRYWKVVETPAASSARRAAAYSLAAGTYTNFTEVDTQDAATFSVTDGYTVSADWNEDGTPAKVTVTDPTAVTWEIYGKLTSSSDVSYPMAYDSASGLWSVDITPTRTGGDAKFYVRKFVGGSLNATYKANYWFKSGATTTEVSTSASDNMCFDWGANSQCSFTLDPSTMKLTVEKMQTWSLYGQCNTESGTSYTHLYLTRRSAGSDEWVGTLNAKQSGNNGKFYMVDGDGNKWRGDYWFDNDGHTTCTLNNQGDTYNLSFNGDLNVDYDVLWNSSTHTLTITKHVSLTPNFPVLQVREGSTWDRPAVFLKGDYLNNNRIVPDWEMNYDAQASVDGKQVYKLKNITLRGAGNEGASATAKLTAVAINADGTYTTASATPSDLESGARQFGRVYNATYTIQADGSASLVFDQVSKYPQFLSLVGYAYQQKDNRDMPNSGQTYHNTSDGWQEAWVLYENGYPLYDNDNNYMYSTQWPPREQNEIQFNAHKDAKGTYPEYNVGMGSNNLIFEQDARGVKKGSEWMSLLKTASTNPDYQDYQATTVSGTGLDGLANDTKYVRYTIPYVWMLGATKVWTGWGSESDGSNAEWDYHMNWGIDGASTENEEGNALTANTDYAMTENKGNFLFEKPTYFKSVEFYLPVNESNEPQKSGAVFYTVETFANVQIDAKACNVGGNNANYDHGTFTATALVPSEYTLKSYKVTRYDAIKSTNENWVTANYKNGPTDGNGPIALSKASDEDGFTATGTTVDGVNWTVTLDEYDKKLANGVYFYGIEMVLQEKGGEQALKTVTAKSPTFRISLYDFDPEVLPLQLVELTDKGKDMISNSLAEYLTYPNGSAAYLVAADGRAGYISIDDATKILKDPETHVWTGKYYVRLFDAAAYEGTMNSEMAAGRIDSYDSPLDFTWTVKRNKSTLDAATVYGRDNDDDYDAALAPTLKVGSAKQLGFIYDNNGLLDDITFHAANAFTYNTTGTGSNNGSGSDKGITAVHIARPYGCWFRYNVSQESTDLTSTYNKYIKVSAPSARDIVEKEDNPAYYDLYVKTADLDPRSLQCEFHFNRPNLSPAILEKYDIYYEVAMLGGSDGQTDLLDDNNSETSGTDKFYFYKDTSTTLGDTDKTVDTYQVTATNVHPTQSVYPRFAVKSTKYVYNVTNDPSKDLVANFGYQDRVTTDKIEGTNQTYDIYLEAPNKTVRNTEKTISNVYFVPLNPSATDNYVGYTNSSASNYAWRYQGHKDFVDPGDVIHNPNLNDDPRDRTGASVNLVNPTFYQMEIVSKTDDTERHYYEFLVKHQHKTGYTFDQAGDDIQGFSGMVVGDGDPLVGNYIFKDVTGNDPTNYYFYVAPVYVFWHDVDVSGVDDSYSNLTPVNPAAAASSAPRREAASVNNSATSADGSLNWTDGNKTAVTYNAQYPMTGADMTSLSETVNKLTAVTGGGATTSPASLDSFPTGIDEAFAEIENGDAVYYDLQGIRVDRPISGQVYIVNRGNKTTKVLVK